MILSTRADRRQPRLPLHRRPLMQSGGFRYSYISHQIMTAGHQQDIPTIVIDKVHVVGTNASKCDRHVRHKSKPGVISCDGKKQLTRGTTVSDIDI